MDKVNMGFQEDWHMLTTAEVYKKLSTGPKGLSPDEVASRLEKYGANVLTETKRRSVFSCSCPSLKT